MALKNIAMYSMTLVSQLQNKTLISLSLKIYIQLISNLNTEG
jgi:hypothetical protein